MKVAGLPKQAAIWGEALHDLWQWPFQELKFNDRFPATNSDRRLTLHDLAVIHCRPGSTAGLV